MLAKTYPLRIEPLNDRRNSALIGTCFQQQHPIAAHEPRTRSFDIVWIQQNMSDDTDKGPSTLLFGHPVPLPGFHAS